MTRRLSRQVVVVTRASSGIGRATALELGRRGASVVLAARDEPALREVAREVERRSGRAHVVPTDVAEWVQVNRLADEAMNRFGRIDTWINNAGVSAYATVEQIEPEEMKRVIEVNLLGVMYGSKAAVARMKPAGGGTIINVGSALSDRAVPLVGAYVASKFGVKGFTEALRMELAQDRSGVKVTLVLPASVNTPLFSQARSRLGVKPRPIPPVYDPRLVAEAIVRAARRPQRDIYVGGAGKLLAVMDRLSPWLVDWWMLQGGRMFAAQMSDKSKPPRDNLFEPVVGGRKVRGEWSNQTHAGSAYTRQIELRPGRKPLLLAAAGAGALLLLRRLMR